MTWLQHLDINLDIIGSVVDDDFNEFYKKLSLLAAQQAILIGESWKWLLLWQ